MIDTEKYHKKLDNLYEYITKYYIYSLEQRTMFRHSFETFCDKKETMLNPTFCEFIQLQSWNNNRYWKHSGGIGQRLFPNVIAYRTYCADNHGVEYNYSEWIAVQVNCSNIKMG